MGLAVQDPFVLVQKTWTAASASKASSATSQLEDGGLVTIPAYPREANTTAPRLLREHLQAVPVATAVTVSTSSSSAADEAVTVIELHDVAKQHTMACLTLPKGVTVQDHPVWDAVTERLYALLRHVPASGAAGGAAGSAVPSTQLWAWHTGSVALLTGEPDLVHTFDQSVHAIYPVVRETDRLLVAYASGLVALVTFTPIAEAVRTAAQTEKRPAPLALTVVRQHTLVAAPTTDAATRLVQTMPSADGTQLALVATTQSERDASEPGTVDQLRLAVLNVAAKKAAAYVAIGSGHATSAAAPARQRRAVAQLASQRPLAFTADFAARRIMILATDQTPDAASPVMLTVALPSDPLSATTASLLPSHPFPSSLLEAFKSVDEAVIAALGHHQVALVGTASASLLAAQGAAAVAEDNDADDAAEAAAWLPSSTVLAVWDVQYGSVQRRQLLLRQAAPSEATDVLPATSSTAAAETAPRRYAVTVGNTAELGRVLYVACREAALACTLVLPFHATPVSLADVLATAAPTAPPAPPVAEPTASGASLERLFLIAQSGVASQATTAETYASWGLDGVAASRQGAIAHLRPHAAPFAACLAARTNPSFEGAYAQLLDALLPKTRLRGEARAVAALRMLPVRDVHTLAVHCLRSPATFWPRAAIVALIKTGRVAAYMMATSATAANAHGSLIAQALRRNDPQLVRAALDHMPDCTELELVGIMRWACYQVAAAHAAKEADAEADAQAAAAATAAAAAKATTPASSSSQKADWLSAPVDEEPAGPTDEATRITAEDRAQWLAWQASPHTHLVERCLTYPCDDARLVSALRTLLTPDDVAQLLNWILSIFHDAGLGRSFKAGMSIASYDASSALLAGLEEQTRTQRFDLATRTLSLVLDAHVASLTQHVPSLRVLTNLQARLRFEKRTYATLSQRLLGHAAPFGAKYAEQQAHAEMAQQQRDAGDHELDAAELRELESLVVQSETGLDAAAAGSQDKAAIMTKARAGVFDKGNKDHARWHHMVETLQQGLHYQVEVLRI